MKWNDGGGDWDWDEDWDRDRDRDRDWDGDGNGSVGQLYPSGHQMENIILKEEDMLAETMHAPKVDLDLTLSHPRKRRERRWPLRTTLPSEGGQV